MGQVTSIGAIIPARAASGGSGPALVEDGGEVSADLLADRTARLAGLLQRAGVGPGARVALRMANGSAFILAHGAASWLGATVVPLPAGAPEASAARQLAQADPALLLTDDGQPGAALEVDGAAPGRPPRLRLPGAGFEALSTALAQATPAAGPVAVDPDAPALLFLTSGTTGAPKRVTLSQRQALAGLRAWTRAWDFSPRTVAAMAAPFSHVVYDPMVLGALLHGGAVVLLRRGTPRAVAASVQRHGVTALMAPPALWLQLLDDPRVPPEALSGLTTVIHGAAPLAPEPKRELSARLPGARAFDCYGLTETASALCVLSPEQREAHLHSVGRPHPGVELSVRDADGRPLPAETPGEVCCRGVHVITSYGDPDLDATRFVDGWLRTGDLGSLDTEGFLTLLGRMDDVINVAGEKLRAAEIEAVLAAHPDVLEAAVVGLPDALKGQVVAAAVVPRAGAAGSGSGSGSRPGSGSGSGSGAGAGAGAASSDPTPPSPSGGPHAPAESVDPAARATLQADLLSACRAALPAGFVPRRLALLDSLPRSGEGKLDRRALAAELAP